MIYSSFSLNGTWEMGYKEEKYTKNENPFDILKFGIEIPGQNIVPDAVPGYWEDMTEKFLKTSFFRRIKVNPEYGLQQYPMPGTAPDMALPNPFGTFFYKREFSCTKITEPTVIHFDGVQNLCRVWLNGNLIGSHEGYSTPFDIEIPENGLIDGVDEIVLAVSNFDFGGYDGRMVSGLTTRASNRYTGGITGDVELRVYNCPLRDVNILISDDLKSAKVNVEMVETSSFQWKIFDGDRLVKEGEDKGSFSFSTESLEYWSPENPHLYTLELISGKGSLKRVFGVRRLISDGTRLKFNGAPYYLRGICEHCYLPETIHLNHDKDYYIKMIKAVKELGFNFVRFHTYIPEEEYMEAADELGMILHVESPNNTSVEEWEQIVKMCRRHVSVSIYCCGNELLIDYPFADHLKKCADIVHENTDSLFSPLSALRGLEYIFFQEPELKSELKQEPFEHNPVKIKKVSEFSDIFNSYVGGDYECKGHSYDSINCNYKKVDEDSTVYPRPRLSHEICIDGTYTDLSLKDRYKGTRVGKTDMFSSIERILEEKGLLSKAPLYFKNSSQWQRRVRKYGFEAVRMSDTISGYDFLGPIDTHWHTFGYDVGMMNEFYELKPGETVRNVLMYNSETVLLNDLMRKTNFVSGETVEFGLYASYFGKEILEKGTLNIRLLSKGKVLSRETVEVTDLINGKLSKIHDCKIKMPKTDVPMELKLSVTLDGGELYAENEWEWYLFPETEAVETKNVLVKDEMSKEELVTAMEKGETVVLFGTKPFNALPTTFKICLAGRCSGNLATVINNHMLLKDMPNEGYCSWQFAEMFEKGNAVTFETDAVPFNPIIEVVSTHKNIIKQSALFEFTVGKGKLIVCGFDFKENDPASNWFKNEILIYANSENFNPKDKISVCDLEKLIESGVVKKAENSNFAFNPNDNTNKIIK